MEYIIRKSSKKSNYLIEEKLRPQTIYWIWARDLVE